MKLYLNPLSPYARVVRIAAWEKGLGERLQLEWVDPWSSEAAFLALNPMSKVPVLITDSGVQLSESLLILHYLDRFEHTFSLFPGAHLEPVLHLAGLGQGLIDACLNTAVFRAREGVASDTSYMGRRRLAAIARVLHQVDHELTQERFPPFSAAQIILGVGLEYMSLRLPDIEWRETYPQLARWRDEVIQRPGFVATVIG